MPTARAGTTTALFGHSQGGHGVLWAAAERRYAPELDVVADVAAASGGLIALHRLASGAGREPANLVRGKPAVIAFSSTSKIASTGSTTVVSQAPNYAIT